jgi:mono/diheme cytochrome c family protein
MYWPTTHMVAPKEDALQCNACHTPDGAPGRLDWEALGYEGDPMIYGSRKVNLETANANPGGQQ